MPADINIHIQYSPPDQAFAAVFVREGGYWHLDGALVGMDSTPAEAVDNLIGNAAYLVLHGNNFLTQSTISLEDRQWLFSMLDGWGDPGEVQAMYEAVRKAEDG